MFSGNEWKRAFHVALDLGESIVVTPRESVGLPKRWSGAVASWAGENFGSPPHPTQSLIVPPFLIDYFSAFSYLRVWDDFCAFGAGLEAKSKKPVRQQLFQELSYVFFSIYCGGARAPRERSRSPRRWGGTLLERDLKLVWLDRARTTNILWHAEVINGRTNFSLEFVKSFARICQILQKLKIRWTPRNFD